MNAHPRVADVGDLAGGLNAHPRIADVGDFAGGLNAHPRVADVGDLAGGLNAHPRVADVGDLAVRVRLLPFAPAGTNPRALAPKPPPRNLRVTGPVGILKFHFKAPALVHEPDVTRTEVNVAHGIVRVLGDFAWLVSHRAPEVRDEPVGVVDDFERGNTRRGKQHGSRAAERLDVVLDVAEALPDVRGDSSLSAEVRERCL